MYSLFLFFFFFFFQAEDGIRDHCVTGVQTCALPICVTATWVGSPSIVTDTAMKLAGESLHGTYGIADFNPDANAEDKIFATAYRAKYNLEPDGYSRWAYDALNVIATAMNKAKSTTPDDIRKAIPGLKNSKGAEAK